MGESIVQLPADGVGRKLRSRQRVIGANTIEEQYFIQQEEKVVSYMGRAGSFKILGAAGTTGQKLASIHNATGSGVLVSLDKITVDVYQIAARVVAPPMVRLHRVTVLPTGGAALPKVAEDTSLSSAAAVTLLQGANAESATTAITATIPASSILAQEAAPRALTLVGYEQFDRTTFFSDPGESVILRALEGVVVNLDYSVATSNPITDQWVVNMRWREYTLP